MLQEQVIPIDFGQGVDTKTDPKKVVAGKFLRVENGVYTNLNRVTKRNGYTALGSTIASFGSLASPQLVNNYNNELIAADQDMLLSYSPSQNAWINRGDYTSTELSRSTIDQENPASGYVDSAILGNYALYAWSSTTRNDSASPPSFPAIVRASVVDLQTGTVLAGSNLDIATLEIVLPVRCVLLGGTTLAVVYRNRDNTAIKSRTVVFSGSGVVSFSSENTVSTSMASDSIIDITPTATGAALTYISTTGITVALLNTSGAVSSSATIADANISVSAGSISTTSNGNIWIYWTDFTAGMDGVFTSLSVYYAVYSSSLSTVLGKTLLVAAASPYYLSNLTTLNISATQQRVYLGFYETVASGKGIDQCSYITATSGGSVGTLTLFSNGVTPFSTSFTNGSKNYAVFLYRGGPITLNTQFITLTNEPTYFVLNLSTSFTLAPQVVARFGSGLANSRAILVPIIGHVSNVVSISTNKFLYPCTIEIQEFNSDYFESINFSPGGFSGNFAYTIDFNSQNSYIATNSGQLSILNGGLIQAYDGQLCSEFGFHLFPEIASIAQSDSSGNIANGVYSYIVIFQWTDAQGNLHQSAPSIATSITTTGSNDTVTLKVTLSYLSQKTGVSVAVYRTQASGSIYYLITDPVFTVNCDPNRSTTTVSVIDGLADANLPGNPIAYTYPGSTVLENSTPPPSMSMVAHGNRLWFSDSENPNTIWYTKSFEPLVGLSPSAFLLQQIDPKFGNISSLSEMDDKLIILKQNGIFVQSGDGADDTGSGSSLSFPQFVPSDVGCDQLKSVVLTPNGVMFHSSNGLYIIDRSLSVRYIGAEVEQYNTQTITDVSIIPGKSQIRFLCLSGLTLVYDYIFSKWATFTNHTGLSSTIWNSSYVYSTGSSIFKESPGVYLDNVTAYSLLLQTSWLALGSVQGFQRVKRLIMLGDFANGNSTLHNLSIAAAYDFSTTFQTAVTYAFGAVSASGVFQYRERLPIQKCDSISLLIQETTTGSNAEYVDLTNISFEAGVKKGVNKLGGLQSVG